jgi:hypothetical protein
LESLGCSVLECLLDHVDESNRAAKLRFIIGEVATPVWAVARASEVVVEAVKGKAPVCRGVSIKKIDLKTFTGLFS